MELVGRSGVISTRGQFDAESPQLATLGHWMHVYIDRESRVTVAVAAAVRDLLAPAIAAR